MILFINELGAIVGESSKNHVSQTNDNGNITYHFREDAKTAEIGDYENGEWVLRESYENSNYIPIDVVKLLAEKKASIQAKTESLINELTFAHPSDSEIIFSASISAGSLWDKLDAKKNVEGFFPLAKTQHNDEIHMIEDLEEFDNLTSLLFATQKIVWDENAQLKQSLNNMSLEDLQNFKDTR